MLCKWVWKFQAEGRVLSCWGLTFVPPDGTSRLLDYPGLNIVASS